MRLRQVVATSVERLGVQRDEPLGKTPEPSTALPPITYRVLHFLVHAGVLLSMGIQ